MSLHGRIGILGGTFDPIHHGHLDVADAARRACDLDTVLLIPARVPPHRRPPFASEYHRFAMTALASANQEKLIACDIELQVADPSFTSVTLERLTQAGMNPDKLFFIAGADAFADISSWHDYPKVLDRSHFVVVSRLGYPVEALRGSLPELSLRMYESSEHQVVSQRPLAIWLVDAQTRNISSSDVRQRITEGLPIKHLVPDIVHRYILKHSLYVSNTASGVHERG